MGKRSRRHTEPTTDGAISDDLYVPAPGSHHQRHAGKIFKTLLEPGLASVTEVRPAAWVKYHEVSAVSSAVSSTTESCRELRLRKPSSAVTDSSSVVATDDGVRKPSSEGPSWVVHDAGVGSDDDKLPTLRNVMTAELMFATCHWTAELDVGKLQAAIKSMQEYADEVNLPDHSILVVCPSVRDFRHHVLLHQSQLGIHKSTKLYATGALELEEALHLNRASQLLQSKPPMNLRPHQHLAVTKAMDRVKAYRASSPEWTKLGSSNNNNPVVLAIGAVPRSGKSHIGLGIADAYSRMLQDHSEWQQLYPGRAPRVLVLTSQPNETGTTWSQGFSRYREFDTAADPSPDNSSDSADVSSGGSVGASHSGSSTGSSPQNKQQDVCSKDNTILQTRWVVLGTQALNASRRKKKQAAAAGDVDDVIPEDESQGGADSGGQCRMTQANRKQYSSALKVIAADPVTQAGWELRQGRPALDQVIGQGFDIILYDEAQHGSTTKLSREALHLLMAGAHCLLVLVSGTYRRPVAGFSVPKEHVLTWSLIDVSNARTGDLKALAEAHGEEYVQSALEACASIRPGQGFKLNMATEDLGLSAYQLAAFKSLYASVPQLRLARLHLDYAKVKDLLPNSVIEGQLNFATLLRLKECSEPQFEYPEAVECMVDELMMTSFHQRPELRTIMAFLHYGTRGTSITDTCAAFQAACEAAAAKRGLEFDYLILPDLESKESLPQSIRDAVQDAFKAGRAGLILLTGRRGGVGLDVKEIDIGWILNDHQSPDLWMQFIYRPLTERRSGDVMLGGCSASSMAMPAKKSGLVIDPQVYRVVQALITYCCPGGLGPGCAEEAVWLFTQLGKVAAYEDGFFDGLLDSDGTALAAADIGQQAKVLAKLYCASRLVTAASTVKRMTDMPVRVRLQPELADLLVIPEGRQRRCFRPGPKGPTGAPLVNKNPGGGGGGGGGGGDESDSAAAGDRQQGVDVSRVLVRVVVMLTCMSCRSLELEPTVENLCQWLQQQDHSDKLRGSIARWIGWINGSAAAADDRSRAWDALMEVSKQLQNSNADVLEDLLQLARTVRWVLREAINNDSSSGGSSSSTTAESSAAAAAAANSNTASMLRSNKLGIVQVINDFLELCGERLQHSFTPRPLLDNMLQKLVAAQPDVFSGPTQPVQQEQQQANSAAAAAITARGDSSAAAHQPRRFLDVGAGTGIMAAAVYDRLLTAGWSSNDITSKMLYIAEPDMAMQYLLAVVFPNFAPGVISTCSSIYWQYLLAVVFPDCRPGVVSSSSSDGSSLPQNIGGVPLPAPGSKKNNGSSSPQQNSSQQQFQQLEQQQHQQQHYDVILSYLPHRCTSDEQLVSHRLAVAACDMLSVGRHAMLLCNNRWRASKGQAYVAARRQLSRYLGDVWDVVITNPDRPSLLKHSVAKNGGEQLVHLAKLEQQQLQQLRERLNYKHMHSCAALLLPSEADEAAVLACAAARGAVQQATAAAAAAVAAHAYLERFDAIVQSGDLPILQKIARYMAAQPAPSAAAAARPAAAAAGYRGPPVGAGRVSPGQHDDSTDVTDSDDEGDDEGDAAAADGDGASSQSENKKEEDEEEEEEEEEEVALGGAAASSSATSLSLSLLAAHTSGMVMPAEDDLKAQATDTHTVKLHRTKGKGKGQGDVAYITEATATAQGPLPNKYIVITTRSADRYLPWGTAAAFNTGQTPNQRTGHVKLLHPAHQGTPEVFAGIGRGGTGRTLMGWEFDTEAEAQHFIKYLKSPLVFLLVSLQKPDSKVDDVALGFVPLPAMTEPWGDERCQQLFGFSEQEMEYIKSRAQGVQQTLTDKPLLTGDSNTSSQGESARTSGLDYLRQYVQPNGSAFGLGSWPGLSTGRTASDQGTTSGGANCRASVAQEQQQQQQHSCGESDDEEMPTTKRRRLCRIIRDEEDMYD